MENFQRQARRSIGGANGRFQWEFLGIDIGHGCRVCDRIWIDVNLSIMSSVRNFEQESLALQVLREAFPAAMDREEMVRKTCRDSLLKGKLLQFSATNDFV